MAVEPEEQWQKDHKTHKNPRRYEDSHTCDWCGMTYPKGGWEYYELRVWGTDHHIICSDCYNRLTLTCD
jgi:hypothetical protein